MKYIFRENESYITDLFSFPGMIYYKEEDVSKNDENYFDLISESSKTVMREMHELILPYKEKAQSFYYETSSDRDFIQLISMNHPIIGHDRFEDYLEELLELKDEELLKDVLYALEYYDQDTGEEDREATRLKVEELLESPHTIMSWLNSLSIGSDAKWHLLSFTQAPKKTLETFAGFMREIHPVFLKFYTKMEKDIRAFGHDFIRRLEEAEGEGLSAVSNGIVKESLLQWEEMDIVISLVNAYAVMLNAAHVKPYISWGYEIEKIFAAIAAKEENRIQERVLLFKNLGDKTRYEVLMNIARGITSTKIIAKNLEVTSATVSYHLNNLVTAKLIFLEQHEGRYTYKVNGDFIRECAEEMRKDLQLL